MKKYVCPCGYEYDPAVGDPDNGIAPGTAWEDVPADWVCPVCGLGKDSFVEAGHLSRMGSLDMARIVTALVDNGFDGYVRPDHGRNVFGEDSKPGYGLYDRALGACYLNGLFEMAEKRKRRLI